MKYRPKQPTYIKVKCAECGVCFDVLDVAKEKAWDAAYREHRGDEWARNNLEPICDACAAKDGAA
jgi:5-methylcytosine-specific restriction endonuclease McrA